VRGTRSTSFADWTGACDAQAAAQIGEVGIGRGARRRMRNGGWRRRQPPLVPGPAAMPVRARRVSWAGRVPAKVLRLRPVPSRFPAEALRLRRVPCRVPSSALRLWKVPYRTSFEASFDERPFAVPSPEGSGSAGLRGKWERHRLAPLPHASSSVARPVASAASALAGIRRFRGGRGWKLSSLAGSPLMPRTTFLPPVTESRQRIPPVDNEDNGDKSGRQSLSSAETLPPFFSSSCITRLWSQMFISALPSLAPV
jgi:hypothetical protein